MSKTITGTFQKPDGSAVAFGTLYLKLIQDATVIGTGQIVPATPLAFPLDANGTLGSGVTIFASDELTPTGISYVLTVSENGGGQVYGPEFFIISGVSPINLNNLTPSANSPVVFSGAVLLNPTAPQTITGQPLTLAGAAPLTLNQAVSNSISLLNAQGNAAPITGTGAVATIYTYTLPGNTVPNLKGFRLTFGLRHSTGAAAVAYNVALNGVSIGAVSSAGFTSTNGTHWQFLVLNTAPTTGVSDSLLIDNGLNAINFGQVLTQTGLVWASNQILTVTFNVANTDAVTPLFWLVELIQ